MASMSAQIPADQSGLSADVDPFVPSPGPQQIGTYCSSPVHRMAPSSPGGYPYYGPPQLYGGDTSPIPSPHLPPPPSWPQLGGLPMPPMMYAAPPSPSEFMPYQSSPLGSSPVFQQPVHHAHPFTVLNPPRSPQFGQNLMPMKPSFGVCLTPDSPISPRSPRSRSPSPSYFPHMPPNYQPQPPLGAEYGHSAWSVNTLADPNLTAQALTAQAQATTAHLVDQGSKLDVREAISRVRAGDARSDQAGGVTTKAHTEKASAKPKQPSTLVLRGAPFSKSPTVTITKPSGSLKVGWPGDKQPEMRTKQPAGQGMAQQRNTTSSARQPVPHRSTYDKSNHQRQENEFVPVATVPSTQSAFGAVAEPAPISYSAALRSSRSKQTPTSDIPTQGYPPSGHKSPSNDLVKNTQATSKKRKGKVAGTQANGAVPQQISSKPKMNQPITFNFEDLLQALPPPPSRDFAHPAAPPQVFPPFMNPLEMAAMTSMRQQAWAMNRPRMDVPARNKLDATAPIVHRGKEREGGIKKKPSALKRVILKEREERRAHMLDKSSDSPPLCTADELVESVDSSLEEGIESVLAREDLSAEQTEPPPDTDIPEDSAECVNSEPASATAPIFDLETKPQIHSRRFREYCDQMLDREIDLVASMLLQELVRFQDRQYHRDPVKARYKRRIVMGLREVTKHLKLKKLKCLIISPNIERIRAKGGLDDVLENIIALATEQDLPLVYALGRRQLGRAVNKAVPVSVVGIFSYDGAQNHFKVLMELVEKARERYQELREDHLPGERAASASSDGPNALESAQDTVPLHTGLLCSSDQPAQSFDQQASCTN